MKMYAVSILGVPFDYGIKLVGGRPGARFGPNEVKKEFFKLIKKQRIEVQIVDYGNIIPVGNNVKKTHEKLAKIVEKIIKDGFIPIVIGGSHDNSFGSCMALAKIYKKIGGINIDAHYDVRPVVNGKINSGTPFRRLLDGNYIIGKNFVELGVHSPSCLPEHLKYLMQKKVTVVKLDSINKIGIEKALKRAFLIAKRGTSAIAFDIDIDGVQKRYAPGCSAPGIKGFTKRQVLQAAFIAGKNKYVKLFNLMEVSPPLDVRNKTVKLASELVLSFIKGIEQRS